jgi:hypothetical protein
VEVVDEIFFVQIHRPVVRFTELSVCMNKEVSWLSNTLLLANESAVQNYIKGDDLSQLFILQPPGDKCM